MADSIIKVSVIIPVYNTEKYLEQCLDSVINQTLREIEIICVDDGSTDRSVEILKEYQEKDPRIQILYQKNSYAGVARNNGKAVAKGEYLVFWDSDDYFMLNALEEMYNKCVEDDADICICSGRQFYEEEGFEAPGPRYIRKFEIPETIPFNRITAEDHVISITVEVPWNKMFRRAFIEKQGLDFKECRNANDVYFVVNALCLADRITLVDKELVYYRKAKQSGLMATLKSGLMNAIITWIETAENLQRHNAFPQRTFANRAVESMVNLLNSTPSWEEYKEAFLFLQEGNLEKLGICYDVNDDYYYVKYHKEVARHLYEDTPEQFSKWIGTVFFRKEAIASARRRADNEKKNKTIAKKEAEIRRIRESNTYKAGRMLTWLPRKCRNAMKKKEK